MEKRRLSRYLENGDLARLRAMLAQSPELVVGTTIEVFRPEGTQIGRQPVLSAVAMVTGVQLTGENAPALVTAFGPACIPPTDELKRKYFEGMVVVKVEEGLL